MDEHQGAGHRARLRDRFEKTGWTGFAEHEVLELLLTLCIPRRDVKPPAKKLLQRLGSLRAVLDAPPELLREIEGIGTVAPVALKIIRETASLYLQQGLESAPKLESVDALVDLWKARLGGLRHEVFEVMYLDTQYKLLRNGVVRVSEGTIDRASVYPREIMSEALKRGAACVALAHNHPSGRAEASQQDIRLTEKICQAAEPLGIKVLDHIIIAGSQYVSFAREHMMPR